MVPFEEVEAETKACGMASRCLLIVPVLLLVIISPLPNLATRCVLSSSRDGCLSGDIRFRGIEVGAAVRVEGGDGV
jgi:hypothetical protein